MEVQSKICRLWFVEDVKETDGKSERALQIKSLRNASSTHIFENWQKCMISEREVACS
jgi:hypothetical protein